MAEFQEIPERRKIRTPCLRLLQKVRRGEASRARCGERRFARRGAEGLHAHLLGGKEQLSVKIAACEDKRTRAFPKKLPRAPIPLLPRRATTATTGISGRRLEAMESGEPTDDAYLGALDAEVRAWPREGRRLPAMSSTRNLRRLSRRRAKSRRRSSRTRIGCRRRSSRLR